MEYNSQRPQLIISEYGRHIQKLIDQAVATENREERNQLARQIIAVMGQLNPQLRDQSDFRHKLWDHLFIMSDFKLDVDSPYPIPTRDSFNTRPERLKYPSNNIQYRHYGKVIENLIAKVEQMEEGPLKEQMVSAVAHHLKKSYLAWNRDSVADETIFKDLNLLSKGKLQLSEGTVLGAATEVLTANYSQQQGKKFGKGARKQGKFKRKFGGTSY
jgi:hypothetical protein